MKTIPCYYSIFFLVLVPVIFGNCQKDPPKQTQTRIQSSTTTEMEVPKEKELMQALSTFYSHFTLFLASKEKSQGKREAVIQHLQAALKGDDSQLEKLTATYKQLGVKKQRKLQQSMFLQNSEMMKRFLAYGAKWVQQFKTEEGLADFRIIMRTVFGPWASRDLLWVADGFGPGAVEELQELLLYDEEE